MGRDVMDDWEEREKMILCGLCGNEVDRAVVEWCGSCHIAVCPRCWSPDYGSCQVCADRQYEFEMRGW